jgi:hypothetical protein
MEECFNSTSYNSYDDLYLTGEPSPDCFNSSSHNATSEPTEDELVVTIIVGLLLGLLILVTIVGKSSQLHPTSLHFNPFLLVNFFVGGFTDKCI